MPCVHRAQAEPAPRRRHGGACAACVAGVPGLQAREIAATLTISTTTVQRESRARLRRELTLR